MAVCPPSHRGHAGLIALQHGRLHLHRSGRGTNRHLRTGHHLPLHEPHGSLRSCHRRGLLHLPFRETGTERLPHGREYPRQYTHAQRLHGRYSVGDLSCVSRPHPPLLRCQRCHPALRPPIHGHHHGGQRRHPHLSRPQRRAARRLQAASGHDRHYLHRGAQHHPRPHLHLSLGTRTGHQRRCLCHHSGSGVGALLSDTPVEQQA